MPGGAGCSKGFAPGRTGTRWRLSRDQAKPTIQDEGFLYLNLKAYAQNAAHSPAPPTPGPAPTGEKGVDPIRTDRRLRAGAGLDRPGPLKQPPTAQATANRQPPASVRNARRNPEALT